MAKKITHRHHALAAAVGMVQSGSIHAPELLNYAEKIHAFLATDEVTISIDDQPELKLPMLPQGEEARKEWLREVLVDCSLHEVRNVLGKKNVKRVSDHLQMFSETACLLDLLAEHPGDIIEAVRSEKRFYHLLEGLQLLLDPVHTSVTEATAMLGLEYADQWAVHVEKLEALQQGPTIGQTDEQPAPTNEAEGGEHHPLHGMSEDNSAAAPEESCCDLHRAMNDGTLPDWTIEQIGVSQHSVQLLASEGVKTLRDLARNPHPLRMLIDEGDLANIHEIMPNVCMILTRQQIGEMFKGMAGQNTGGPVVVQAGSSLGQAILEAIGELKAANVVDGKGQMEPGLAAVISGLRGQRKGSIH